MSTNKISVMTKLKSDYFSSTSHYDYLKYEYEKNEMRQKTQQAATDLKTHWLREIT